MTSCWVINFKNGTKIMLSEEVYREKYLKETPTEDVQTEEHWFDVTKAQAEYPDIDFIESVKDVEDSITRCIIREAREEGARTERERIRAAIGQEIRSTGMIKNSPYRKEEAEIVRWMLRIIDAKEAE